MEEKGYRHSRSSAEQTKWFSQRNNLVSTGYTMKIYLTPNNWALESYEATSSHAGNQQKNRTNCTRVRFRTERLMILGGEEIIMKAIK